MNIYSQVKSIISDLQHFRQNKFAAAKILDWLTILSAVIICLTFIFAYEGHLIDINTEKLPIFPVALCQFLDRYTAVLLYMLIFYKIIVKPLANRFLIYVCVKCEKNLMPFFDTVDNILEIYVFFILAFKLTRNLLLCLEGTNEIIESDKSIYIICAIWFTLVFFYWLYEGNRDSWDLIGRKYTPYYDYDGKRIAEDDRVVYYNRLYYVHFLEVEKGSLSEEGGTHFNKREWYLSKDNSSIIHKEILLEEAVRDEKGKIKVHEFGMGESWKIYK